MRYKTGTSNFQLITGVETDVLEELNEECPYKSFDLVDFSSLESRLHEKVNIIGIVTGCEEVTQVGVYTKRGILLSNSMFNMNITMLEDIAVNANLKAGQIVIVESPKSSHTMAT